MPVFSEILHIARAYADAPQPTRYAAWVGVMKRLCNAEAEQLAGDYANLFSLLLAVCRERGISHKAADSFRHYAHRVLHDKTVRTPDEEREDLACLCHFAQQMTGKPVPPELPLLRIDQLAPAPANSAGTALRGIVTEIEGDCLTCLTEDGQNVCLRAKTEAMMQHVRKGDFVGVSDIKEGADGKLIAGEIVLEPDYLIDVTALASCLRPYGNSPLGFLLSRFAPPPVSLPILLGNATNQFMAEALRYDGAADDAARLESIYRRAASQHFAESALSYAALEKELAPGYFQNLKEQFSNVFSTVGNRLCTDKTGQRREDMLVEASFLCPELGLRGRFDVMSKDMRLLVEVKSGKAEEFSGRPQRPRAEHKLQMTLYSEMLRRNFRLSWNNTEAFLLYTRYPMLFNERVAGAAVSDSIVLRNGIMALERALREGHVDDVLSLLTEEQINERGLDNKFYHQYLRPQILDIVRPIQERGGVAKKYFDRFLTFLAREQFRAKTDDHRPDSNRSFAALWRVDEAAKSLSGDMLAGLRPEPMEAAGRVESISMRLPEGVDGGCANFSPGEMVLFYEEGGAGTPNATTRQLYRGYIESIGGDRLTMRLPYEQPAALFAPDSTFRMEHDYSDAPFSQAYRNLFSLLTAPEHRRALLLGERTPEADKAVVLHGTYQSHLADVLLRARQAKDYFLLVGPPGTGKTNVALRALVEEFIEDRRRGLLRHGNLLLTAYTNRAVDEICGMLENVAKVYPEAAYIRIGAEQTCAEPYRPRLFSNLAAAAANRRAVSSLLDHTYIYIGTLTTLTGTPQLFRIKQFDCALFDEASQILEPQALGLLCAKTEKGESAIGKFVFIGDHKQLPAVVLSPEAQTAVRDPQLNDIGLLDTADSLFERLHRLQTRSGDGRFVGLLNRQGRMHPDIADFVNRKFYGGELRPVPLPHQKETALPAPGADPLEQFSASTRLGFIDIVPDAPPQNNKANEAEADMVARLVQALIALYGRNGREIEPAESVGIIVPFRSQIACVRSRLQQAGIRGAEQITVDTVECYQGSQRDFIIFSTTISRPYQLDVLSSVQRIGGADIDRKLNVAITRARRAFFMIGNRTLLEGSDIYKELIAASECLNNKGIKTSKNSLQR